MLDELGERRSLSYGLMRLANVRQMRGEGRGGAFEAATRATEDGSRPGRTPGSGRPNWRLGVRGAACRTLAGHVRRSSN